MPRVMTAANCGCAARSSWSPSPSFSADRQSKAGMKIPIESGKCGTNTLSTAAMSAVPTIIVVVFSVAFRDPNGLPSWWKPYRRLTQLMSAAIRNVAGASGQCTQPGIRPGAEAACDNIRACDQYTLITEAPHGLPQTGQTIRCLPILGIVRNKRHHTLTAGVNQYMRVRTLGCW